MRVQCARLYRVRRERRDLWYDLLQRDWSPGCRIKSFGSIGLTAYTLKTLSDDKDAFRAMGTLVNLISYYAHELMNRNLDRFD